MTLLGYEIAYDVLRGAGVSSQPPLAGGGGEYRPPVLLPNHEAEREARGGDQKLSTRGF